MIGLRWYQSLPRSLRTCQRALCHLHSTIDWYNAWPRAALHSVAYRVLSPQLSLAPNGPHECGVGPKAAAALMRAAVEVHGEVSARQAGCVVALNGRTLTILSSHRPSILPRPAFYDQIPHCFYDFVISSTDGVQMVVFHPSLSDSFPRSRLGCAAIWRQSCAWAHNFLLHTNTFLLSVRITLHRKLEPAATSFLCQLGRRVYISAKSYLDFLHTFLSMLREHRKALSTRLGRYAQTALSQCGERSVVIALQLPP